jgi:hypothetical protein
MNEGNGRSDKLNFGKHKDKEIGRLITVEPGYLCWLRDETLKTKRQAFFDQDVNDALDRWVQKDGSGRYRNWTKTPPDFAAMKREAKIQIEEAAVVTEAVMAQATTVAFAGYGSEWGAF